MNRVIDMVNRAVLGFVAASEVVSPVELPAAVRLSVPAVKIV